MAVPEGDWGSSEREDEYTLALVDPFSLQDTGETLAGDYGSSTVNLGYYTDNYYSASLSTKEEAPPTRLVRVYHTARLRDGTAATETLGTYFVDSQSESAEFGSTTWDVTCESTWLRFTADSATRGSYEEAGREVSSYIVDDIIGSRGGIVRRRDGGGALTLGSSCEHNMGDSMSQVIDDLVAACDRKATVDDEGYVVIDSLPDHSTQAEAYTFVEGPSCTFKRGYQKSDSNDDKVNRVVALGSLSFTYTDNGQERADVSESVELPESDPFSFASIGRYVTRADDYGELDASDMTPILSIRGMLKGKAQATLDENSGSIWYYEIEHAGIPGLRHGDVVRYVNYTDGQDPVDVRCLITEMEIELGAGCMTKTKLKVI